MNFKKRKFGHQVGNLFVPKHEELRTNHEIWKWTLAVLFKVGTVILWCLKHSIIFLAVCVLWVEKQIERTVLKNCQPSNVITRMLQVSNKVTHHSVSSFLLINSSATWQIEHSKIKNMSQGKVVTRWLQIALLASYYKNNLKWLKQSGNNINLAITLNCC